MQHTRSGKKILIGITAVVILFGFLSVTPLFAYSGHSGTSAFAVPLAIPVTHGNGPGSHGNGGHGGGGGGGSPPGAPTTSPPYSPSQIRSAYGFSSSFNASGETIAIIDAYGSPSIQSDLNSFDSAYGLPAITIHIVQLGSKHISKNAGWALETSLDVEYAHAMAPLAKIVLIETSSASSSSLITSAVNYAYNTTHANVVSMSWGLAESQMTSSQLSAYDSTFQYVAQHGMILVAASGDSGANDGTSGPTVNFPAASPYVVGVGGTTLTASTSGGTTTYQRTAWSSSGGGVSQYFGEPTYQSTNNIKIGGRGVPDVSYDANPNTGVWIYDTTSYEGLSGWIGVGGTSAGAPQWAAIFAEAQHANSSLNGSNVLAALYSVYNSSSYNPAFHDITSGSNGAYTATTGYDEVTGIGSPNVSILIPLL